MGKHDDRFEYLFNNLVDDVKALRDAFEKQEVGIEGYEVIRSKARDIAEVTHRLIIKCDLVIAGCEISLFQRKEGDHICFSTDATSRLYDVKRCNDIGQLKYTLSTPGLQQTVKKAILSRIKKLERCPGK